MEAETGKWAMLYLELILLTVGCSVVSRASLPHERAVRGGRDGEVAAAHEAGVEACDDETTHLPCHGA